MPNQNTEPLHVISVSLGSSSRNHTATAHLLNRDWVLERRGTDGDIEKARQLIGELDGKAAAIGLGGIDLYLIAGGRRYILRDAQKLAAAAKTTPVVDGSGLKDTLERATVQTLQNEGILDFKGKKVLLACAVDRFGMAEELVKCGANTTFGDLLFILNVPVRLRTLGAVRKLAAIILPIACRLPFKMLYPTGEAQTKIVDSKSHRKLFEENEIIAGDFLLIRRFLPENMSGKTILTNTVT
ncbi:quinate 5-dehydrogenase, partial [bacterium]